MTINFKEIAYTSCGLNISQKSMDYQPISCDLYDYLEMWSIHKQRLFIEYLSEGNQIIQIETKISNTITKNKEEFIILESTLPLRLDKIVSITEIL